MSNMLNTALDLMGFLSTEEDDDGSQLESNSRKDTRKIVSLLPKPSQPTIIHMTPKAFDEVIEITKSLQDNKIVTINLALVDVALRNRIFDFASGSVYALDGGVMKLADNVYLLAGKGVTLKDRPIDASKSPWSKV